MLTRIRIEVSDEDSAALASDAMDRYERAITASDEVRHGRKLGQSPQDILGWNTELALDEPDDFMGREVTDEVIEYDASLPGYKGRRVICFKRLDTRGAAEAKAPVKAPEDTANETSTTVSFSGSAFPLRPRV